MPLGVLLGALLATSSPGLAASGGQTAALLRKYLAERAADGFSGVVIVARGDDLLVEEAYGLADREAKVENRVDSVFTVGSITKQFTATAILQLEVAGKLSLSDPLSRFWKDAPADKAGITIHQLLTHTSGLASDHGDDHEPVGRDAYVARVLASKLESAPGERHAYANSGYSLLAAIVELVSREGYEDYLAAHLFAPAGMKDTGYVRPKWAPSRIAKGYHPDGKLWGTIVGRTWLPDGPGWNLRGNGGIHATVSDMRRWHVALRGDTLLPAASRAKLHVRHVPEGGGTFYGYGWSIEDSPWGELVTHNGGNGFFFADCLRFLEPDVFIYYATNSRDRDLGRLLARIVFEGVAPERLALVEGGARWGLPDTPVARRAASLLDAIATGTPESRAKAARELFTPEMLGRRPPEEMAEIMARCEGDFGSFRVARADAMSHEQLVIRIEGDGPEGRSKLDVTVEEAEPHRIARIGLEAGR